MKSNFIWIVALVLSFGVQELRVASVEKTLANERTAHAQDLKKVSDRAAEAAADALAQQKFMTTKLATLDKQHSKEKADALAENTRLAADARTQRLRITAACPAGGDTAGSAPSAPSVAAGTSVELPEATGQAVFDIRAGIIADQALIRGLQDYVSQVCVPQ